MYNYLRKFIRFLQQKQIPAAFFFNFNKQVKKTKPLFKNIWFFASNVSFLIVTFGFTNKKENYCNPIKFGVEAFLMDARSFQRICGNNFLISAIRIIKSFYDTFSEDACKRFEIRILTFLFNFVSRFNPRSENDLNLKIIKITKKKFSLDLRSID